MKTKTKEMTEDGYEIIYISSGFFNAIEKWLNSTARFQGSPSNYFPLIALRDVPAKVEFRVLERQLAKLQKK